MKLVLEGSIRNKACSPSTLSTCSVWAYVRIWQNIDEGGHIQPRAPRRKSDVPGVLGQWRTGSKPVADVQGKLITTRAIKFSRFAPLLARSENHLHCAKSTTPHPMSCPGPPPYISHAVVQERQPQCPPIFPNHNHKINGARTARTDLLRHHLLHHIRP